MISNELIILHVRVECKSITVVDPRIFQKRSLGNMYICGYQITSEKVVHKKTLVRRKEYPYTNLAKYFHSINIALF